MSSLATDPLGPRWPPAVIRSFTSIQMVRSHTQTSYSHTTLSHTVYCSQLSHTHTTLSQTQLPHTSHTHNLFTHDINVHSAWQAWHLATSMCMRGRRGTWSHRPSLCMASVALGDIDLHSAWHAWHLVTSTFISPGTRGPCGTELALVARLGLSGHRGTLRGRRGTW